MRRAAGVAVWMTLAGAAPALAQQKIEIAPMVGYRFGGGVENLITGNRYEINPAVAYGGLVEIKIGHGNRFTVMYSRQDTEVDTSVTGGGIPLLVQYLTFGGTRNMRAAGNAQPFVTGALGMMIASMPGTAINSTTRLSLSAAVGARMPAGSRIALRAEIRGFLAFVGETDAAGTCGGGGCAIAFQGTGLLQGEAAAGITFRF